MMERLGVWVHDCMLLFSGLPECFPTPDRTVLVPLVVLGYYATA